MWTIRKLVKKGDYLYAVVPEHPKANKHGYVLHHRIVAENTIGRVLDPNEVVHHKNGDKHDNRAVNLEVLSRQKHTSLHNSTGRTCVELLCAFCGIKFRREVRQTRKGYKRVFCSRSCNGKFYSNQTVVGSSPT